ncbi:MAG: MFS transporter [Akkermansiaceae bacterium]|nr:MFS transporter [Akkermansiaceae bacterium]
MSDNSSTQSPPAKSSNPIFNYFSEFGVLKECGKNFWLTNFIQFFDGLSYFTLIIVFTLFLKEYCGFRDADAPYWVGMYTLFVSLFVFAVGSICDIIGLKRTYLVGFSLLITGRLVMALGSDFGKFIMELSQDQSRYIVMAGIGIMAFGTAFMSPCITTSIRRFTTLRARPTGFNFYYLFMNIGALLAGFAIVDPIREQCSGPEGLYWVINFGTCCNVIAFIFTRFINEDFYAVEEEKISRGQAEQRRPLQLIAEVIRERPFQKLLVFLFLTLGVRLVFTLQFMIMPQYYTRTIGDDFQLGFMNSLNPFVIISGLILIIPIINKFSTVKLMISGMSISALSLVLMAVPPEWYFIIPGIETISQAYFVAIFTQIIVFAFGELLFSPRFSEYVARVAPKDKVASYMSLAGLPMFIAKPINGVVGGLLVSKLCYDGIAAKMDTGHISFFDSPEFMWTIYLIMAIISPLAIILTKDMFVSDHPEEDSGAVGSDDNTDSAAPQEA